MESTLVLDIHMKKERGQTNLRVYKVPSTRKVALMGFPKHTTVVMQFFRVTCKRDFMVLCLMWQMLMAPNPQKD